jgi:hypothetical protein
MFNFGKIPENVDISKNLDIFSKFSRLLKIPKIFDKI